MRVLFCVLFMLGSLAHAQSDVFNSEPFSLYNHETANFKTLRHASTHVCTLTRIDGGGRGGRVFVAANGYWTLERFVPKSSDTLLWARCYQSSAFFYYYGGTSTVRWVSENFSIKTDASCGLARQNTWWSDAGTILQGVNGYRNNASKFVLVAQEQDYAFTASRLYAYGCDMTAYGNSFFVGIPHSGQMAKFQGPLGFGTARQAGAYHVEAKISSATPYGGLVTTTMAPVNSAMCYFTYINGEFREYNMVRIHQQNGNWVLQAWVGPSTSAGNVRASAMCMLRGQY